MKLDYSLDQLKNRLNKIKSNLKSWRKVRKTALSMIREYEKEIVEIKNKICELSENSSKKKYEKPICEIYNK